MYFENAEKDYIQSIAKLLKGKYKKVTTDVEQEYYEIGGIVGKMPVAAKVIIKPRPDHYLEVYINVIDLHSNCSVYSLKSAPDFVYENLEKWVDVKVREMFNVYKN